MYDNDNAALTGFLAGRADNNNCCGNGMNGMWGGEWFWPLIILFALFGWNGNGNGWGGNNGANAYIPYAISNSYTDSAVQRGFDTQTLVGKLDGISNGICDSTFALNNTVVNGFNNVARDMCTGFANVAAGLNENRFAAQQCCCDTLRAIDNSRFDTQAGFTALGSQLASCCCETQRLLERGFADTNYNMATNTCAITTQMANSTRDIIDSQNAGTRAILDYLCQEKISDLQNENQSLRLAASQANQNAAIGAMISASEATILRRTGADCPVAAYVVQPPSPVTFPTNCCGQVNYAGYNNYNNNGCGCGCGSCCN